MSKSRIPLWRYAEHTKPGSTHHRAFWNALEDAIPDDVIRRIEPTGDLREIWEAEPAEARQAKFTTLAPFSFMVTPHIAYGELALYQEKRRFTAQHQCDTAQRLCRFMEEARAAFGGAPVIITSGYRPPAVNAAVGGASQSEHLYNAPGVGAVDFYLDGVDVRELQGWVDRAWPFSVGYGAPKGFVHVGIRHGAPRVRWNY